MKKGKEKRNNVTKIKDYKAKSEGNNLQFYLNEIKCYPLLNREEEKNLAIQAASGNKYAREKLINSNLRFVVNIARKFQGLGLPLEDLVAEGNTGLISAVDKFDINKNCHLISYAVWWIRQALLTAIREKSKMIKMPGNRAYELLKIERAGELTMNNISTDEEMMEIANFLNMKKDHIKSLLKIPKNFISLNNPAPNSDNLPLIDFIQDNKNVAPDRVLELISMEADIDKILNTLDNTEAEVLRYHYGLGNRKPLSLKEIGEKLNLSKERIRQIEEKAISRLKNHEQRDQLNSYVA